MTYHNTLSHEGETLREYQAKAGSQDEKILAYMKSFSYGTLFTPTMLHRAVFDFSCPITSVRRALSNLTNANVLVKTEILSEGMYGREEHNWRLADPVQLELV